MKKPRNKYSLWLKILICSFVIIMLGLGGFLVYANDYYHAADEALKLVNDDNIIQVEHGYFIESSNSDIGLIFYPGAKVEAISYLPLLTQIADLGINVYLVEMPFNMAIFDVDAADPIIKKYTNITDWYIAGHSMGGAMASKYADENSEKIKGLILLGAYIYGDYPTEKTLTIYGSLNQSVEDHLDYTQNVIEIVGGNHAQFGNYGKQKGDHDATISSQMQQKITVKAIEQFIFE